MQLLVAFQDNAFMDTDIYIYIYFKWFGGNFSK